MSKDDPSCKRRKVVHGINAKAKAKEAALNEVKLSSPLHPDVFNVKMQADHKAAYMQAKPYPHASIDPLCTPERASIIRNEIVTHLPSNYKETDLFKVYQTIDLANVDSAQPELASKLPNLLALRDALYSSKFRSFMSEVTGCGELSDRVDMAASAYSQGCHLLCHDDVIGTRAISFIVYLSDEEWSVSDGGALELYGLEPGSEKGDFENPQGIPTAAPMTTLLPLFNSLAFFVVNPGRSYHSVQEVFTDESPRLSIQGWFHRSFAPEGVDMASLNQLKEAKARAIPKVPITIADDTWSLTLEDQDILKKWINPTYLNDKAMSSVRHRFDEESSVQLRDFLLVPDIEKLIIDTDSREAMGNGQKPASYEVGIGGGWDAIGPAHMQRYLRFTGTKNDSEIDPMGSLLERVRTELFQSETFARFLFSLTGGRVTSRCDEVRRFRAGLDYTVAHHGLLVEKCCLDATLCFVNSSTGNDGETVNSEKWESGEVGGFQCFIAAENEENTAAEVYCDDDATENDLLSVAAVCNTFSLVLRDPDVFPFIKYVSAQAPSSRWDIVSSFDIDFDDEEGVPDGDDTISQAPEAKPE